MQKEGNKSFYNTYSDLSKRIFYMQKNQWAMLILKFLKADTKHSPIFFSIQCKNWYNQSLYHSNKEKYFHLTSYRYSAAVISQHKRLIILEVILGLLVLVLAGEEGGGEQQNWDWWRQVSFLMSDRANSRHLQNGPTAGQSCPSIMLMAPLG